MNICVFCSSSNQIDRCYIAAAQELGRTIAECGHTLVFGGYDMGLNSTDWHEYGSAFSDCEALLKWLES